MGVMMPMSVGLAKYCTRDPQTQAIQQTRVNQDKPSVANPLISFGLLRRNSTLNFAAPAANIRNMELITTDTTGAVTQLAIWIKKVGPQRMVTIMACIEALSIFSLVWPGTIVSFWFVMEERVFFSERLPHFLQYSSYGKAVLSLSLKPRCHRPSKDGCSKTT